MWNYNLPLSIIYCSQKLFAALNLDHLSISQHDKVEFQSNLQQTWLCNCIGLTMKYIIVNNCSARSTKYSYRENS